MSRARNQVRESRGETERITNRYGDPFRNWLTAKLYDHFIHEKTGYGHDFSTLHDACANLAVATEENMHSLLHDKPDEWFDQIWSDLPRYWQNGQVPHMKLREDESRDKAILTLVDITCWIDAIQVTSPSGWVDHLNERANILRSGQVPPGWSAPSSPLGKTVSPLFDNAPFDRLAVIVSVTIVVAMLIVLLT